MSAAIHQCAAPGWAASTGKPAAFHSGKPSSSRRDCNPRSRSAATARSEEHTSELQSLMRISYAVFCLKKKKNYTHNTQSHTNMRIQHRTICNREDDDTNRK